MELTHPLAALPEVDAWVRLPGVRGTRDDETTIRSEDEISFRTAGGFSAQERHRWRPLLDDSHRIVSTVRMIQPEGRGRSA
jgi:hypothetical protein